MANDESRLPAPEQLMIVPMSEIEVAEMIERHIEYVDKDGRSVHLHPSFVKHYMRRDDGALPTVTSIAQLPIVLYDGTVLTGRGLDRRYGIYFRVPEALDVPKIEDCTPEKVAAAMRYLTDEWLCDVAADYTGKCIIIASTMTVIERMLLPQRPAFFVTAGRRGNGKTTTIHMISMAATGLPASAAAWSGLEEERRKALFSYLGYGLAMLVWDNIKRGTTITCPSIEKSLTTEFYIDRVLGVSEVKTVPAYTVQFFTGNNIAPRGEMTSRSMVVRLDADRPDPENRKFAHADPVGWTDAHRGKILKAIYTILLGNPRRRQQKRSEAPTQFKEWWDMIGSAVEFAVRRVIEEDGGKVVERDGVKTIQWPSDDVKRKVELIDFTKAFRDSEEEDEEEQALTNVLVTLEERWPGSMNFAASQLAEGFIGEPSKEEISLRVAIEEAAGKGMKTVSTHVLTWRLKALKDNPVQVQGGKATLVLRYVPDDHGGLFRVERSGEARPPDWDPF